MAIIDHIDVDTRKIYLSSDTVNVSIHPISIYKEMRALRAANESLRGCDVFMKAYGNIPKGGDKFTERYVVLQGGTMIVPYNQTHILGITGTLINSDGEEGAFCFDKSELDNDVTVDINYVPPQVEIIYVDKPALTQEEHDHLMELSNGNGTALDNYIRDTNKKLSYIYKYKKMENYGTGN